MSKTIVRPTLSLGNHIYLYRLLRDAIGCGKQTFMTQVEEALTAGDMTAYDLGFESTRELLEELDDCIKLTVFKGGRLYATVIANEAWDAALETVDKLVRKYHTRDPYELCQLLGIKIHYYDLQKKLKGFFYYQSRQKNIVIDHNVNGILERILVAHELGHAVLHTKIAMMHGFQEMEVFDDRSIEENEANFFAAELLLEDGKVLECLSEHTFFETAKMLYVPAALLDYKFSLLHEKGELVNSMYIRKADFLKEDLHAYDNDIGYGDI